jgi:hypothetical protein
MSDVPGAQGKGPEGPSAPHRDSRPSASASAKRSGWGAAVTPVVLAVLGLALLVVGLILYPRRSEHPAPVTTKLDVFSTCPLFSIGYAVDPARGRPGVSRLEVRLTLPEASLPGSGACVGGRGAGITVVPPAGTHLMNCNHCHGRWTVGLPLPADGVATAYFYVRASSFGVFSNGADAFAAIPEVVYIRKAIPVGTPELVAAYDLPSASSYDWSADPPVSATNSHAIWEEPVSRGTTAGREAAGIDQAAQASDNFMSFLAGALLALGGAAILAAVIEAVHTRDWDLIRALRPK